MPNAGGIYVDRLKIGQEEAILISIRQWLPQAELAGISRWQHQYLLLQQPNLRSALDGRKMYHYLVNSSAPHAAFNALGRVSLRLKKYAPDCIDLRARSVHPLEAVFYSLDSKFLLDIDLEKCLGLHAAAYPCAADSAHPFIRTLRDHARGNCRSYDHSALSDFYASFQPQSAADVIGLPGHALLSECTPFASALPWEHLTPAENETFLQAICTRDYIDNGFKLTAAAGWKGWGPISHEAGEAEFSRLLRVFKAIGTTGYQRHPALDGDIEGQIMKHDSDYRIMISRGQHRIAALAAIGMTKAPIRLLPQIISRSDAAFWPNVVRGYYTSEQALAVFDRIFHGRQPDRAAIDDTKQSA
jgi:hypothetical protein